MAKPEKNKKPELVETDANGAAVEGAEGATEAKGGKKIMLTVDGVQIARTDYIRQLWDAQTHTRSEITALLNTPELNLGKPVPYQIVFAATKGRPGGKFVEKAAKAAPAEGEAQA